MKGMGGCGVEREIEEGEVRRGDEDGGSLRWGNGCGINEVDILEVGGGGSGSRKWWSVGGIG